MEDNRFTSDRVRDSLLIAKWIMLSMKLCLPSAFPEEKIGKVKLLHITARYSYYSDDYECNQLQLVPKPNYHLISSTLSTLFLFLPRKKVPILSDLVVVFLLSDLKAGKTSVIQTSVMIQDTSKSGLDGYQLVKTGFMTVSQFSSH